MVHATGAAIRVVPTGAALGADIEEVDLSRPLSEATIAAILQAWADYQVLRFRGQRLTDDDLVAFSRYIGEPDVAPVSEMGRPADRSHPEVTIISNVVVDGRPIGALGASESFWHTDMSYDAKPPSASLLYGIEIPPSGGDTGFSNMYLAAERLPDDLRRQIEGRSIKHDATSTSAGDLRKGFAEVADPREAAGTVHPILRTHPVTGRKALFIGRRKNAYVVGMDLDESDKLLDRLFEHVDKPEFVWTQTWRVGDLVMWDNRCVMHRRDAFDPTSRRLMHRTQIKGDVPF